MEPVDVELPGGIRLDGSWRRDARLRPLAGRDEAFVLQQRGALFPAALTTAVLARCLCRLGPVSPVTPDIVRRLSVGDREALLLHLRRLALGERMPCVLECPACREKLDLDLAVSELLVPSYDRVTDTHELSVAVGDNSYRVRFRLPNGADQEQAAQFASSPDAATELILRRCIQEVVGDGEISAERIPTPLADRIAAAMAELDPQAELAFDLTCPTCAHGFQLGLDVAGYLYRELGRNEADLYRDVHLLALHYHWSENAILRLSRRTRLMYLDLLSGTAGGGVS